MSSGSVLSFEGETWDTTISSLMADGLRNCSEVTKNKIKHNKEPIL